MYGWIWRHLPGNLAVKVLGAVVLLLAVLALLFFVVFPFVGPRLPFNDVTVEEAAAAARARGAVIGWDE